MLPSDWSLIMRHDVQARTVVSSDDRRWIEEPIYSRSTMS